MDKRTQNTRERIRAAYVTLLTARDEPKLTVTALARQANIDRKTFYLHYDTMDDVMMDLTQQIVTQFVERLEQRGFLEKGVDVGIFYQTLGQTIGEHGALFRYAALRPSQDVFWEQIKRSLAMQLVEHYREKFLIKPDALYIYLRFLLGGMQEIYREWLRGELKLSIEELSRMAGDAAFEGFSSIIK